MQERPLRENSIQIKRALISVSDKNGLVEFASGLADLGVEIISSGGTACALAEAGLKVRSVEEITGSPEMLGGRVKTLHPAVHGGILARRDVAEDMACLEELGIAPIDLVVVNLYPFEQTAAKQDASPAEIIEQIDIGGPTLLRSAAKNFASVAVVCDPADYPEALKRLNSGGGQLDLEYRTALAAKVFARVAAYDEAISTWFGDLATEEGELRREETAFPSRLHIALTKERDLRYGENPHQAAALYREAGFAGESLVTAEQLQGKKLSFNNMTDLEGAWQLASEFESINGPFCAIIKHANPCGASLGKNAAEAFEQALECDPISAFGGIVALNCEVDAEAAEKIKGLFFECLVAPAYSDDALEILRKKKNARVLRCPLRSSSGGYDIRRISGGLLLQDYDLGFSPRDEWNIPTVRKPSIEEATALEFAWRICKHVKSNAIVYANPKRLLGVGAGQMSRVDSAKIAAGRFDRDSVEGPIVMASDAYFPFRDGLDAGAEAGASAVIQPGGSKRDAEVIEAADEHGIAMVFTGRRHFRH